MATYVNDLRLKEIATGDESGTWGTSTNTNLELIGEALGYGSQDCFSSDANATTTVADGATDPARALYFKVTSSATLSATRELTIAPNTVSRVMIIENATTGSQIITIKQGSGNTVNVANGAVKVLYLDGAGSGAAVQDGLVDLDLTGTTTAVTVTASGVITGLTVEATGDTAAGDNAAMGYTGAEGLILTGQGSSTDVTVKNDADATVMSIATGTTQATFAGEVVAASLDISGNIDVDGTTNLDAVDIDGAVQIDNTVTVGADDTGYDVKFFGATASAYMLWDEDVDDLILAGAARIVVPDGQLVLGSTAVSSTAAELNILDGVTSTTAELNILDGVTSTAAELNVLDPALKESDSIYIGSDPSGTTSTANYNTALGTSALDAITTADANTAIGRAALTDLTTSPDNTAVGAYAGEKVTTGNGQNTFVGAYSGEEVSTGAYNTAAGYNSGGGGSSPAATGNYNSAFGYASLQNTTSASSNVAVGGFSMQVNTTGTENVAVGYQTLDANLTGNRNAAVGHQALSALNPSGDVDTYNSALGYRALATLTTGTVNTGVGHGALENATTGYRNTAAGGASLQVLTTGYDNVAVGSSSLQQNTEGYKNIGIGYQCMALNTTGSNNVAMGENALRTNVDGHGSVAVGWRALYSADPASAGYMYNVAMGFQAGYGVSTGKENIFIGGNAGHDTVSLTTGNYNVVVGTDCRTSAADSANQIVLGHDAACNADDSFVIGNGTTDSAIAFGATSITAPSDVRYKENIESQQAGLSFINDLRPVTFDWKKKKDLPKDHRAYEDSEEREMNDKTNHGFIAQEVKAVIDAHPEIKNGLGMWSEDEADGRQRVGPGALVPILVTAIQELSAELKEIKEKL